MDESWRWLLIEVQLLCLALLCLSVAWKKLKEHEYGLGLVFAMLAAVWSGWGFVNCIQQLVLLG